jgi:spoIIIJ-associated protein
MPWVTKEGRTVEEAQQAAIAEAGRPADELDIEVVSEGAKGLFGLGGEPAVVRVRPKDEATDFRAAFHDDITPSTDSTVGFAGAGTTSTNADTTAGDDDLDVFAGSEDGFDTDVPDDATDRRSLSERQEQAAELGAEIVRGILERMEIEGDINTRIAGGTVYIEVFGDEMGILIGRSGTTLEALQEIVRAGIQRRLKTRQAVVVDVEAYWERRRKPQRREERGAGGRGGGRGRQGGRRRPSPNGNR